MQFCCVTYYFITGIAVPIWCKVRVHLEHRVYLRDQGHHSSSAQSSGFGLLGEVLLATYRAGVCLKQKMYVVLILSHTVSGN